MILDKEAQMKPKCALPIATAQILKDPFQWNQNEKSVACQACTLGTASFLSYLMTAT